MTPRELHHSSSSTIIGINTPVCSRYATLLKAVRMQYQESLANHVAGLPTIEQTHIYIHTLIVSIHYSSRE